MQRRNHKRRRLDTTPEALVVTESVFENIITLPPVMEIFFVLPAQDITRFSMTAKLLHRFYQDETCWKMKFLADFHQTVFDYDYRLQYIAEYLYRIAQKTIPNNLNYRKLKEFINQHHGKDWTYYYLAVLSQHDELGDPQSILENETTIAQGFRTLKLGELRGALFLINYVDNKCEDLSFTFSRLASLVEELFAHLLEHSNHPDIKRLQCLTQCLLTRPADESLQSHQQQVLNMFIGLLTPDDTSIAEFLQLSSDVFRRAGLISSHQACLLRLKQNLLSCTTVFDVVIQFIRDRSLPEKIRSTLSIWSKNLVENAVEQETITHFPAPSIPSTIEETTETHSFRPR